jgi:hypothetical protein
MSAEKTRTNFLFHRVKEYLLKGIVEAFHRNPGKSVFDEAWDHLIILDDCRFDVFSELFEEKSLPGELRARFSLGSWTGEFLLKNFNGTHDDVVYVTANPFVDKYLKGRFHRIISVWRRHWDGRYNTVPPGAVYRETIRAMRKYPDKRLVVHFLQPHHPYFALGSFRDNAMTRIRNSVYKGKISLQTFPGEPPNEIYLSEIYAYFPLPRLIKAYTENLRVVVPYVELLLHKLGGRVVVTSDHGELFGERVTSILPIRVYGHGIGRVPGLTLVPWWVVEEEDRSKLRPVKDIKKEIATIERRFKIETPSEKTKLKNVISSLKFKDKL